MKDYSNYHNTDTKNKIENDALILLQRSLDGYAGKDIVINGEENAKALLSQRYDSDGESYKIIGHIKDIQRGNLIQFNNENWLITTKPEDNGVYRKAVMSLCNSTFPIEQDKISILMTDSEGKPLTDKFGDEIYKGVGGGFADIPCVVETTYFNKDNNVQLPLPDNSIKVTIQYTDSSNLKENYEFEMYGKKYKVSFIDYSKVINRVGIITMQAKRVV